MQEIKRTIFEYIDVFIKFSENLSATELWMVLALSLLLIAYLAYRTFGLGAVLGLVLIAFFAFILYQHPSFDAYKVKQKNDEAYIQEIQKEINKGIHNKQ